MATFAWAYDVSRYPSDILILFIYLHLYIYLLFLYMNDFKDFGLWTKADSWHMSQCLP